MRKSAFAKAIEEVSIEAIASIAAIFARQDIAPAIATGKAFELLELAAAGKLGIKVANGWEENIARLEAGKTAYAARMAADFGEDVSETGEDGKRLPVDFGEGLASVFKKQNPGKKPVDYLPEFKAWLMEAEGTTSIEAGERISAFRKGGIPSNIYQHFRLCYSNWRTARTRSQRSESGKKGQEKKKEKKKEPASESSPKKNVSRRRP